VFDRSKAKYDAQNLQDTELMVAYRVTRLQQSMDRKDRIWAQEVMREMKFRKLPPFNR
jgi:hypothetical protein